MPPTIAEVHPVAPIDLVAVDWLELLYFADRTGEVDLRVHQPLRRHV
jgi:hypothetical protein